MPPKGGSGRPSLVAPSQSHRDHFSIASFFDAATAPRGGGAYRLDSSSSLSPYASASPRGSHGSTSNSAGQHQHQQQQQLHWANADHSSAHLRGGAVSFSYTGVSSPVTNDVSGTLQEVRSRIVGELDEAQQGGREAAGKLHVHRQRALKVAFGEEAAASKTSPLRAAQGSGRSSASAGATGGNSPATARASPHNDKAEGEEEELMVSSVEFSLLCPYSRLPILHPVRSRDCNHLQCCDLESWIVMLDKCRSMRDPVGPCPVCERRVTASSLEVDLWMKNVIDQMPSGTHMVVLEPDGSFRNGDVTREKRKEQMMMVVDATQGDYENYFGDVTDEESDDVVVQANPPSSSSSSATISAVLAAAGTRRPRSLPPGPTSDRAASDGGQSPAVRVKREQAASIAAAAGEAGASPPPSPSAQDDGGVVVVHFVEGQHDGRQALPSQIRLWVPHCTQCGASRVKAEDGSVEGCPQCGQNEKEKWNLVRRFETSPAVSMELMTDGTLVLHGVDLIAPYLYRAGFHRSLFDAMEYASVAERQRHTYRPLPGVWATSYPLSRFEIDFLEACCGRIAQGTNLDEIETLTVPSLFRIPRRRRPGAPSGYSQSQQSSRSGAAPSSTGRHPGYAGGVLTQDGSRRTP
ncbi:putative mitochondrial hypothetical protein [Leptomonas pyrrhocoris]|uniref:SP-RING-type domain-containing protein n=1 Tax=Leptomonas pyrrhocoris TaxID=157538 RepID=A0A0N1J5A9_LEPPY|nr:putative mitochondrial hypothetical protein [Leptomonas pyrrhocoris]KPA84941.1 putative mitochondrial hypothetical protein [Leptomonas pyrrhocoris]|eukprot:XP_015663380.1 putative mitochondrial hypothetical protein [Leptomonas pyrrhocoris]